MPYKPNKAAPGSDARLFAANLAAKQKALEAAMQSVAKSGSNATTSAISPSTPWSPGGRKNTNHYAG